MKTGGTVRDQYTKKGWARVPPEAQDLPLPEALAHVMDWFQELSSARGSTGFGMAPLSYQEIEAWARLRDVRPTPFEVQALKDVDMIYLASIVEKRDEGKAEARGAGDGR